MGGGRRGSQTPKAERVSGREVWWVASGQGSLCEALLQSYSNICPRAFCTALPRIPHLEPIFVQIN